MFIGDVNYENDEMNKIRKKKKNEWGKVNEVEREYKKDGIKWVDVGDEKYGEGRRRENEEIEKRNIGGSEIIVK